VLRVVGPPAGVGCQLVAGRAALGLDWLRGLALLLLVPALLLWGVVAPAPARPAIPVRLLPAAPHVCSSSASANWRGTLVADPGRGVSGRLQRVLGQTGAARLLLAASAAALQQGLGGWRWMACCAGAAVPQSVVSGRARAAGPPGDLGASCGWKDPHGAGAAPPPPIAEVAAADGGGPAGLRRPERGGYSLRWTVVPLARRGAAKPSGRRGLSPAPWALGVHSPCCCVR